MEQFIESNHCSSRIHCETCRINKDFRNSIANGFEWDGNCPDGHFTSEAVTVPSKIERAKNLTKAIVRKSMAQLSGKKVRVPEEVYKQRYDTCKKNLCGYMVVSEKGTESCGKCGCPWKKKLKWATEKCPLDYWQEHEVE